MTPAPPGAPTALAVRGGTGTATVTWGPPAAAGSGTITGYVVDGVAGRTVTVPATARTTVLTGLAGGTTHRIAVRATSTTGDGPKATVTLTGVTSTVTAAPAAVRSGAAATLSGRLTPVGGGTATAAKSVQVQQLPAGQRVWKPLATVVTTRTGTWTRVIRPTANAAYRTVLVGGPGLLANISPSRTVTVSHAVTLKAATTTPKAGARVAITGTQKPARAGTKVTLQRLSGRTWVTVSTTTTKADGTYAFSRTFTRGTVTLRATLAGGPLNTAGTSPTVKLTVR